MNLLLERLAKFGLTKSKYFSLLRYMRKCVRYVRFDKKRHRAMVVDTIEKIKPDYVSLVSTPKVTAWKNVEAGASTLAAACIKSATILNKICAWSQDGIPDVNYYEADEDDYSLATAMFERLIFDKAKILSGSGIEGIQRISGIIR
jgi:hypothetical protein